MKKSIGSPGKAAKTHGKMKLSQGRCRNSSFVSIRKARGQNMLSILTNMKKSKSRSLISKPLESSAESSGPLNVGWNPIRGTPNKAAKSTNLADAQRLLARLAVKILTEAKVRSR
jgi:hypothetical protein